MNILQKFLNKKSEILYLNNQDRWKYERLIGKSLLDDMTNKGKVKWKQSVTTSLSRV